MFTDANIVYNLDTILQVVTQVAWVLFIIYAVIFFIRSIRRYGPKLTIIRMLSFRVLGPLLLALTITVISAAIVFVPPQYVGVVVSLVSPGGVRPQPLPGGFHLIVPFLEQVQKYPIYWQTYTMSNKPTEGEKYGDDSIRARTSDGQEVRLDASLIFQINSNQAVQIHIDWQDRYVEELLRPRTRGLIRDSVAKFTVDEVNSVERTNLELELDRELRNILEDHGFLLDTFVLRNITFSDQYAHSVEQKQVQEQGQTASLYKAEQIRRIAGGEADAVVIKAEAEASKVRIKAQAQADARVIQAEAEARAHVIEAEARAEGLRLVNEALQLNPDNLLTYQYINRLSPNIKALLLPNNAPFVLPLPGSLLTEPSPQEAEISQPENILLQQESFSPPLAQPSIVATPSVTTTKRLTGTVINP